MTKTEFAGPFKVLQEIRDFSTSKDATEWWYRCVQHLPASAWRAAVESFCQQDTGMAKPTPARVLRHAGVYGLTPEERGDLAWGAVAKAMRTYGSVQFDDPAVNLAILNCGGWVKLRSGPEGENHFRKAAFVKAYAACVRAGKGSCVPLDCLAAEYHDEPRLIQTDQLPRLGFATAPTPRIGAQPRQARIGQAINAIGHSMEVPQ